MTWPEQRARFPVLDRHAYLNAGTFGPLARPTLAAMAELRAWEGEHGRGGRQYFDTMIERRERVRELFAAQVGAPADHVALTDSTTEGVQVVVTGLGLGASDEVATTDAEHFGLTGPLLGAGARLSIAKVQGAPAADVFELIREQVTPHTRLIALSAVSWLDGTIFPWRELREATNVPVLVDGAQSVGALAVDATAADFYTVSGQKWLCGPDSTGALYVRDPDALRPRLVAYPSAETYDIARGHLGAESRRAPLRHGFRTRDVARRSRSCARRPPGRAVRPCARARGAVSLSPRRAWPRGRFARGSGDARLVPLRRRHGRGRGGALRARRDRAGARRHRPATRVRRLVERRERPRTAWSKRSALL